MVECRDNKDTSRRRNRTIEPMRVTIVQTPRTPAATPPLTAVVAPNVLDTSNPVDSAIAVEREPALMVRSPDRSASKNDKIPARLPTRRVSTPIVQAIPMAAPTKTLRVSTRRKNPNVASATTISVPARNSTMYSANEGKATGSPSINATTTLATTLNTILSTAMIAARETRTIQRPRRNDVRLENRASNVCNTPQRYSLAVIIAPTTMNTGAP